MERIVFAGTPEFALASLKALVDAGRKPIAVYTQPDRPAGRGRKLTASPVKQYAQAQGIDVHEVNFTRVAQYHHVPRHYPARCLLHQLFARLDIETQ